MPKTTELWNYHIAVEKSEEVDRRASPPDGPEVMRDVWKFIFTDKLTGDEISISFPKETRDSIVQKLVGGIHLPTI